MQRAQTYLGEETTHFVPYGLMDITVGRYDATSGMGFATVEMFRYPDFVRAFGAYSEAKTGPIQYVANMQNEAFLKAHSLHIWKGAYYIRIIGEGSNGSDVMSLARFATDRIPAAPARPAVFAFLPDKFRVPNSERYVAQSGFGQRFFANSFQATFNVDNDIVQGLVVPAANKQGAAQLLDLYKNVYIRNGKLLDPIANLGEDNFTAEDRYMGRVVAFRIDRFVVAFNGFGDRQHLVDLASASDQKILGLIRKQLVRMDEETGNGTP